jgi:hypothetical protein
MIFFDDFIYQDVISGGLNFPISQLIKAGQAEFDLAWHWLTIKKEYVHARVLLFSLLRAFI